jgi:sporulation protein YlmC with PRC-barrel domain
MARREAKATLLWLSDTGLTVADRTEDIRGRKALDMAGEGLGIVNDLLIDEHEQRVRFLEVSSGGFLGLGAKNFLIPVDTIMRITEDRVYIGQGRERVSRVLAYDPTLVDEPYLSEVYECYGYPPYWGPDSPCSPYPYFP